MSMKPTHHAYIVIDLKEGSEKKANWIEVGAVWKHKKGEGFDVVLPQNLSVSGRLVCMPVKEKSEK